MYPDDSGNALRVMYHRTPVSTTEKLVRNDHVQLQYVPYSQMSKYYNPSPLLTSMESGIHKSNVPTHHDQIRTTVPLERHQQRSNFPDRSFAVPGHAVQMTSLPDQSKTDPPSAQPIVRGRQSFRFSQHQIQSDNLHSLQTNSYNDRYGNTRPAVSESLRSLSSHQGTNEVVGQRIATSFQQGSSMSNQLMSLQMNPAIHPNYQPFNSFTARSQMPISGLTNYQHDPTRTSAPFYTTAPNNSQRNISTTSSIHHTANLPQSLPIGPFIKSQQSQAHLQIHPGVQALSQPLRFRSLVPGAFVVSSQNQNFPQLRNTGYERSV
jgi:hypothetical protein